MSFKEFALAINAQAGGLPGQVEQITTKIGFELFARVVQRTPVRLPPQDTPVKRPRRRIPGGRARGGWQAQVGAPPKGAPKGLDASGSSTVANAQPVILGWPLGSDLYLANNVEYIGILEQGRRVVQVTLQRGSRVVTFSRAQGSIQAQDGMVAVTIAEIKQLFQGIVA